MAIRPIFEVANGRPYVTERRVEFKFYNGFSETQKIKSISSLHQAYCAINPTAQVLEISSKSENRLGVMLSAFNLMIKPAGKANYSVESAFQSSKVFEEGGPYTDLLAKSSYEAKKDARLRSSGALIGFEYDHETFPKEPKTFFYDWLYVNALAQNSELAEQLLHYSAFSDIEFNPQKSINCQARSAAIFVSLHQAGLLESALKSKNSFLAIVYSDEQEAFEQIQFADFF